MTRINGREYPGVRRRVSRSGAVTYQARWRAQNGKEQFATFDTVREAVEFRGERTREVRRGATGSMAGGRRTYSDWHQEWYPQRVVRSSTAHSELCYLSNHVLPYWGQWRLVDITRPEVARWVQGLAARGLAPATVAKIHRIFLQPLRAAEADGHLHQVPQLQRGTISVARTEARFLTPSEAIRLEQAFDPWWALTVPFLIDVGLRIGELAALRVGDVDLSSGIVRVHRTSTVTETGGRIEALTKTLAGIRRVPTLTDEIADRVGQQIVERHLQEGDHLFGGRAGAPLHPSNYRRRSFSPAAVAAGLAAPLPTPHALRHTAVATWIAAGAAEELSKIALWLGHEQIATVYKFYAHLLPVSADETRHKLGLMREQARRQVADGDAAAP